MAKKATKKAAGEVTEGAMTQEQADALVKHHGASEKEGSYDDLVVGTHKGEEVTIGQLRNDEIEFD